MLLLALAASGLFAGREILRLWEVPLNIPDGGYTLNIEAGDTLTRVAQSLQREGVLAHPLLLTTYGRITGLDAQIKRGEYRVPQYATAQSLLELLTSGEVVQYRVTFPEGITLSQALDMLHAQVGIRVTPEPELTVQLHALVAPYAEPEGLFFPAGFQYTRGTTELEILRRAHHMMTTVLQQEWRERAADLPYDSPYEALVMASIVEKETGLPEERAEIAGVFVRRLQRGMRLQTDPTVIYGLGPEFDGNLTRRHLADDRNRFNTYRHAGLPPTPIALPGREALHAAMHPAAGKTLYFVARGDGGHVFSETLAEHQKAVRKYQLRRRQDYRSAP